MTASDEAVPTATARLKRGAMTEITVTEITLTVNSSRHTLAVDPVCRCWTCCVRSSACRRTRCGSSRRTSAWLRVQGDDPAGRDPGRARRPRGRVPGEGRADQAADVRAHRLPDADHPAPPARCLRRRRADRRRARRDGADRDPYRAGRADGHLHPRHVRHPGHAHQSPAALITVRSS